MPILYVFYIKLALTLLSCVAGYFLLTHYERFASLLERNKTYTTASLIFITRVIPFILVFIVLKELPRGDIPFFYYKGTHALRLELVYRDFWSFHAPLFSYLLALPLLIVHHPASIVALMMVGEVICVLYTYRFCQERDKAAFRKLVHYLIMPAPMIICLLGGQEDIWLWGFALWGLAVLLRTQSEVKLGLVVALALLSLKVTVAFFLFPLFFSIKNKVKFVLTLALVGIPSIALLYSLVGLDFLMLVKHTEDPYSPNLYSILRPFMGQHVNVTLMNWIGLGCFLPIATWIGFQCRTKSLEKIYPLLFIITYGLMQLFLPSAMAYYMFIYFIVLVFVKWNITDKRYFIQLLLLNILLVVQPFVYVSLDNPVFDSFAFLGSPALLGEYLLECGFVVLLVNTVWLTYKELKEIV